jgi:hypothetical protein
MSGDIWHAYWQGRDSQGNIVLTIGPADSQDLMHPPDSNIYATTATTYVTNGGPVVDVVDMIWVGSC